MTGILNLHRSQGRLGFRHCCVAIGVLCLGLPSAARQATVRVSLELPASVTEHEPVQMYFVIENPSTAQVSVNLGWSNIRAFRFVVVSPTGATSVGAPRQMFSGISPGGTVTVAPRPGYSSNGRRFPAATCAAIAPLDLCRLTTYRVATWLTGPNAIHWRTCR